MKINFACERTSGVELSFSISAYRFKDSGVMAWLEVGLLFWIFAVSVRFK